MYNQISSNIWKSWLLMFVFLLLVIGVGFAAAQYWRSPIILPLAVIVAIVMSVGSYYNSDKIVLAMSGAHPAEKPQYAHLINSVEGLAIAAGMPAPRVYIIDDSAPNAFATGRDPAHGVICVTTGLLQKLGRTELEGVIGHEMSHIKNFDIRFSTLVVVMVGIVALLSDWMLRSMWWGGGRKRDSDDNDRDSNNSIWAIVAIVVAILAPLAAVLMQAALSRQREFLADANGALLTRYPDGLASALEKIAADPDPLEAANKATAALYIYNPLKDIGGTVNNLFDTHPPIEERVRRLRAM
jgi:heat shock protein HtpX